MANKRFSGFKTYKAPVFTVTCPQSGNQYEVRSLNVGEVTRIKESLITQNRISETINDILWDAVQKETLPNYIRDKEDFENYTTLNDRTALVYGLYTITFGSSKEYELMCGHCSQKSLNKIDYSNFISILQYPKSSNVVDSYIASTVNNEANVNPEMEEIVDTISIDSILSEYSGPIPSSGQPEGIARSEQEFNNFFEFIDSKKDEIKLPYVDVVQLISNLEKNKKNLKKSKKAAIPKDVTVLSNPNDILNKRVEVTLPETKILVIMKAPVMIEEIKLNNRLIMNDAEQLSIATDIIFIDRIEEYEAGSKSPVQVISDPVDILSAYYSLPIEDRKYLVAQYEEEFGKYGITININWKCPDAHCGQNNELEVDILHQFFRTVTST
jgi:hypothetical protein